MKLTVKQMRCSYLDHIGAIEQAANDGLKVIFACFKTDTDFLHGCNIVM